MYNFLYILFISENSFVDMIYGSVDLFMLCCVTQ